MLLVGWGGATLRAWIVCAALTALAFLYIQGELFVSDSPQPLWFYGAHAVFLASAAQWMGLTIAALHDRRFDPWVSATLWLTGSASIARQGCAGRRGLVLVLRRVWRW